LILRWLTERGVVAISKSVHKERIIENFDIFDFELSKEDMERIATIDMKKSCFFSHNNPEMVKLLSTVKFDI